MVIEAETSRFGLVTKREIVLDDDIQAEIERLQNAGPDMSHGVPIYVVYRQPELVLSSITTPRREFGIYQGLRMENVTATAVDPDTVVLGHYVRDFYDGERREWDEAPMRRQEINKYKLGIGGYSWRKTWKWRP